MKTASVLRRSAQLTGLVLFAVLSVVLLLIAMPASAAIDPSSFASKTDLTTNLGPTSVAIGDLDGDGQPDLAVSNYGSVVTMGNTVRVFRNTGVSGNVSFAPALTLTTQQVGPHGVEIGDINGDGKPDVVVTRYGAFAGGTTVSVFRNTSTIGNLSFASKVDFTPWEKGPLGLAIGDIDGDNKPELAVTSFYDGNGTTVSVFRNTSASGSVSFTGPLTLTTGAGPYGIAMGDINADGKLDLAVANHGLWSTGNGTTVSVFRNTSTSGSVSFAPKVDFTTGNGPRGVAISDIDADGLPDLAVTNFGDEGNGATVSVLRNTSVSGSVAFAPKADFATGTGPLSVASGDFDKDGKLDLALTNFRDDTVSVLGNTSTIGNVSFAPKVDFATGDGDGEGTHGLAIGDINGDSWLDLAVTDYGAWLVGDGTTVSVLRKTPFLTVTKSAVNEGGNPLHPGERITYTIIISNAANITATNVVVSDAFPAHTNFVVDSIAITPSSAGGTPGSSGTQPVIASGITVTAQSLVTVTYAVTVDSPLPDQTVIINTASVTSAEMVGPVSDTISDTVTNPKKLNFLPIILKGFIS